MEKCIRLNDLGSQLKPRKQALDDVENIRRMLDTVYNVSVPMPHSKSSSNLKPGSSFPNGALNQNEHNFSTDQSTGGFSADVGNPYVEPIRSNVKKGDAGSNVKLESTNSPCTIPVDSFEITVKPLAIGSTLSQENHETQKPASFLNNNKTLNVVRSDSIDGSSLGNGPSKSSKDRLKDVRDGRPNCDIPDLKVEHEAQPTPEMPAQTTIDHPIIKIEINEESKRDGDQVQVPQIVLQADPSDKNEEQKTTGTARPENRKPAPPPAPTQHPPTKQEPTTLFTKYVNTSAYNEFGTLLSQTDRTFELEKCPQRNPGKMIHALSYFKTGWDFLISIVYTLGIILLPIVASITASPFNPRAVSLFFSGVYLIDLLLNWNTIVLRDGQILLTIEQSRRIFLREKLFVHIISTVPLAAILESTLPLSSILLLTHMLKAFQLYTHFFTNPVYQQLFQALQKYLSLGGGFMSMFILGTTLTIFLHFHACMYFLFGRLLGYKTPYWDELQWLLKSSWNKQYTFGLFAAIGNTFPVTGYRPSDPVEQWIAILLVLFGGILYAVLVGTISSFSFGLDSSGRMYKQKMDEVSEYMNYKKLNGDIKQRVKQFYELKFRGKYFDEIMILNELNLSLRQDIAIHNCRDLIAKVSFLRREVGDGRDENFLRSIATALQPVYFIHGDRIIEQGQIGNEMYFIYVGIVDIEVNGNKVGSMKEGSFFGEVALLGQVPRTATIRAQTNCILYLFHRLDLEEILKDYDDMSLIIQKVYEERMVKVNAEQKKVK